MHRQFEMAKNASKDAVSLLKADHRKVEGLFEKYEAAEDDDTKKMLATKICTELTVHATIEEEIFYPACSGEIDDDLLDEAYVEHDGAKVLIAQIAAGEPGDEYYDAKVKVLSELIKHHVKEEEAASEGIFAQAKEAGLDADALAEELLARKEELLAEIEADGIPAPETRSYSDFELVQGSPVDAGAEADEVA